MSQSPGNPGTPHLLPAVLVRSPDDVMSIDNLGSAPSGEHPLDYSPAHTDVTYPGESGPRSPRSGDDHVISYTQGTASPNMNSTTHTMGPPPTLSSTSSAKYALPPFPVPFLTAVGSSPALPQPAPLSAFSITSSSPTSKTERATSTTAIFSAPPGFASRRGSNPIAPTAPPPPRLIISPPGTTTATPNPPTSSSTTTGNNSGGAVTRSTDQQSRLLTPSPQASPHAPSFSDASYLSFTERSRSADGQASFMSPSGSGRTHDYIRMRRRLYGAVGPPPAPPGLSTGGASGESGSRTTFPTSGSTESGTGTSHANGGARWGVSQSTSETVDVDVSGDNRNMSSNNNTNSSASPGQMTPRMPPPLKGYLHPPGNFSSSFAGFSNSFQAAHSTRRGGSANRFQGATPPPPAFASSGRFGGSLRMNRMWRPHGPTTTTTTTTTSSANATAAAAAASGEEKGSRSDPASPRALPAPRSGHSSSPRRHTLHWSLGLGASAVRPDEDIRQQAVGASRWQQMSEAAAPPFDERDRFMQSGELDGDAEDGDSTADNGRMALVSCAHCGRSVNPSEPSDVGSPFSPRDDDSDDDAAAAAGGDANAAATVVLMECPCELVAYCSTECQLADWPAHALHCIPERQWMAGQCHQDLHRSTSAPLPIAARKHADSGAFRECLYCQFVSCTLLQCRCGEAVYCSVACQQRDWPCHRYMCGCVEIDHVGDTQRQSMDVMQSVKALLRGEWLPSQAKTLGVRLGFVASVGTQTAPQDLTHVFPYAADAAESDTSPATLSASHTVVAANTPSPPQPQSPYLSLSYSPANFTPSTEMSAGAVMSAAPSFALSSTLLQNTTTQFSFGTTPSLRAAGTTGTTPGATVAPYSFFGGRSVLLGTTASGSGGTFVEGGGGGPSGAGGVRDDGPDRDAGSFEGTTGGGAASTRSLRMHVSTNDDLESLILTRQPSRRGSTAGSVAALASTRSGGGGPRPHSLHHHSQQPQPSFVGSSRRTLDGTGYARSRRGSVAAIGSMGSMAPSAVAGVSSFYGAITGYGNASLYGSFAGSGSTHDSDKTSGFEMTNRTAGGGGGGGSGLRSSPMDGTDVRRDPHATLAGGRRAHTSTGLTAVLITSRMLITDDERKARTCIGQQFIQERIAIELRSVIKEEADARMAILYDEVMWCVKVGDVAWKQWKAAVFNFYYKV